MILVRIIFEFLFELCIIKFKNLFYLITLFKILGFDNLIRIRFLNKKNGFNIIQKFILLIKVA